MTFTIHKSNVWEEDAFPVDATYRFRQDANGKNIPNTGYVLSRGTAPRYNPWTITGCAVHNTGTFTVPDTEGITFDNLIQYIRAMQRVYARTRAYSLGYNWAVDYLGGIWEIRGWDIKTAAHAPGNEEFFAILVMLDNPKETTPIMEQSIRYLVEEGHRISRLTDYNVIGHKQVPGANTACPDVGIMRRINQGFMIPQITPPAVEEVEDMPKVIQIVEADGSQRDIAAFVQTGTMIEWISDVNDLNSLVYFGAAQHNGNPNTLPVIPFQTARAFLSLFTLIGPQPVYPTGWAGPRTYGNEFRQWII